MIKGGEKLAQYLNKKGIEPKQKEKQSPSNINSAAKQKELLVTIAKDLGYLE